MTILIICTRGKSFFGGVTAASKRIRTKHFGGVTAASKRIRTKHFILSTTWDDTQTKLHSLGDRAKNENYEPRTKFRSEETEARATESPPIAESG